jgi:hypothetical protein
MSEDHLRKAREKTFAGIDRDQYLHVGYFLTWYGMVEHRITLMMAMVAQERDLEAFHLVTKGMDARTKTQRLRELCKVKNREIGPNLLPRLKHFQDNVCKFRDRLSHTALIRDENEERFHFMPLDRSPAKALGMPKETDLRPTDSIDYLEFFERGYWLNWFNDDLAPVVERARTGLSLEIDNPRSPLRVADPANPLPQGDPPTLHTRDRRLAETPRWKRLLRWIAR